ncbi:MULTISPECIES: TetR/AcrR family transcriptional regulator [unclassified Oscillibacter]|uniref:TetR/AcrR family transcriptional regulator n=1 Tax=unclassified Oscillibacter TaxID=2629304 RepID=UPI0025F52286|nr:MULTISPECIES: TetR/AcrR family transcriptional regulator [unclassified Oscillibacter]
MSKISDRRRADILHSALTEFGLRGVDGASMSEIAARAGIGKSTIYEYFPSKTELIIASCEMKIGQIREEIVSIFSRDISFSAQMELYVEMMLDMAGNVDFNEVVRIFTRDSIDALETVVDGLAGDMAAILEQAILRAQAAGELVEDIDVSIAAAILLGLPNPHLILRLRQLGKEEPVKALVKLALRGLRTIETPKNA